MAEELKETAPVETAAESGGEDAALYGSEEIAEAFLKGDGSAPSDAGEEGTDGRPLPPADAGTLPKEEGGGAQDAGTEADAAPEAPEPVMPEGWEEAMWQAATPEMRAKVAEQAQAHAAALAREVQARQKALQEREQFTVQANAQLQQALATMQQVVEGEFRQVDWNGLANSDPASYVQLQRMYNERMGAIRQIQQNIAAQVQAMQQARAAEEQRKLHAEFETAEPVVRALVGAGYEGKKFAGELAQYLASQGVPAEAVNGLSRGYELTLAAKAMLYDRLAANRAAAAKKVAEAPKVQAPAGKQGGDGGERLKKAMSVLKANPSSTDAIAGVFENL